VSEFTIESWGKSVTVSFPDDMSVLGPEAFALTYDYQATLVDDEEVETPNPEDKASFALNKIIEYVVRVMRTAGVEMARDQAVDAARADMDDKMAQITVVIEEA
jgi:hypothetical protein